VVPSLPDLRAEDSLDLLIKPEPKAPGKSGGIDR
jgi:hypothetical protein